MLYMFRVLDACLLYLRGTNCTFVTTKIYVVLFYSLHSPTRFGLNKPSSERLNHKEKQDTYINNCPTNATIYSLLYFRKLLYMFRVVSPLIIRSTYNCKLQHLTLVGLCRYLRSRRGVGRSSNSSTRAQGSDTV